MRLWLFLFLLECQCASVCCILFVTHVTWCFNSNMHYSLWVCGTCSRVKREWCITASMTPGGRFFGFPLLFYSIWFFLVYSTSLHPLFTAVIITDLMSQLPWQLVWRLGWLNWPGRLAADFSHRHEKELNWTEINCAGWIILEKKEEHGSYELQRKDSNLKEKNQWIILYHIL